MSAVPRSVPMLDPVTFQHRYEDAAMEIVSAIKRELLPSMDGNDGGEILHAILSLCEQVYADGKAEAHHAIVSALQAITDHFAAVMAGPMIAGHGIVLEGGVEGIPTIKQAREALASLSSEEQRG